MIGTDLTSVATHGWYTDDTVNDIDLLTAVSTFGWYGITIQDLIDSYPTLTFGLIIDQLHDMGLTIDQGVDIDDLEITSGYILTPMQIARLCDFN